MTTTYIAPGILEWHLVLHAGGAEIPVYFTGGRMSGNGMVPASFTTGSHALQQLIEQSKAYKTRRIIKV